MALIYCDGFDDYGTGSINAVPGGFAQGLGGITFTATGARTGNAVLWNQSGNAFNNIIQSVFPTGNPSNVFVGCAMNNTRGFDALYGITLYNGTYALCSCVINVTYGFASIYRGYSTDTLLVNVPYALPNTGYTYLEMSATISNSNGSVKFYINGILVASVSGVSTMGGGGPAYVTSVWFYQGVPGGSGYQFWIDDFYMCDNTTAYNNNVLGPIQVKTLLPNGIGATTNMSVTGVSTNYQAVNNNPEDADTTYVSSGTAGTLDLYTQAGIGTAGYPLSVMIAQVQRLDGVGIRTTAGVLQINGTEYDGGITTVSGTSYAHNFTIFNNNPNTGGAWTSNTIINNMQIGTKIIQ